MVFPGIVGTDDHNNDHENTEEFLNRAVINAPVDNTACHSAADTAGHHENESSPAEFGNGSGCQGYDKAGRLAEQDDIKTVRRGSFCIHTEKVIENDQVDRPAADTQETGHHSEKKADSNTDCRILGPVCPDMVLAQRVNQGAECHDEKTQRLYSADGIRVWEQCLNIAEKLFSTCPSGSSAKGQESSRTEIYPFFPGAKRFKNTVGRHAEHGAAGQKTDGRNAGPAEKIQERLYNDTAADAADGTDDGC